MQQPRKRLGVGGIAPAANTHNRGWVGLFQPFKLRSPCTAYCNRGAWGEADAHWPTPCLSLALPICICTQGHTGRGGDACIIVWWCKGLHVGEVCRQRGLTNQPCDTSPHVVAGHSCKVQGNLASQHPYSWHTHTIHLASHAHHPSMHT